MQEEERSCNCEDEGDQKAHAHAAWVFGEVLDLLGETREER